MTTTSIVMMTIMMMKITLRNVTLLFSNFNRTKNRARVEERTCVSDGTRPDALEKRDLKTSIDTGSSINIFSGLLIYKYIYKTKIGRTFTQN